MLIEVLISRLLALISCVGEQVNNAVAVVALNDYLAILGCATHATLALEHTAQLRKVVVRADKTLH